MAADGKQEVEQEVLRIEQRDDGVAILWMDDPAESMNTLKASFVDEFSAAFDALEATPRLKAVVFASGKPDSFVAGANIDMLNACKTAEDAAQLSRLSQRVQARMAAFKVPIVAAIHGVALGGGLEITLPCHGRVATDDPRTRLGLPEVQLGLLPGGGGTQRLVPLVGLEAALDLLLTPGKTVDGRGALALGLVDEVVPRSILIPAAVERALALASGRGRRAVTRKKAPAAKRLRQLALAENPVGRKLVFEQARKQVLARTGGHYPAPLRILDVVRVGLERGLEAGLAAEAEAFGQLVVSPEAKQLIGIYFATTELKKDTGVDDAAVRPRPVRKVGVLGAGLMGSGIAAVSAIQAGLAVRLRDRDDAAVGRGLAHVRAQLDARVARRRMRPTERDAVMARVAGGTDLAGFGDAEVVVEAVFEDLAVKHQVLRAVEEAGRADVIFASNTSSLPIAAIAEASRHPETVIGMHYFSPVEKMPLLEIIVTPKTAPWVTATCVELGKRQGKQVIVVHDGVGFYTSRILAPYANEAAYLLAEGVPVDKIDRALTGWGFPVGPLTLLDEVGIDVADKVAHVVHDAFGDRMAPPEGMAKLIADERRGRKNGRGFYLYGAKRKTKGKGGKQVDETVYAVLGVQPANYLPDEGIAERCVLQMVNEAALCFGEGILRSARDGDVGAIFGLGFPPFRGGPFRLVDAWGAAKVVERLDHYRAALGPRFEAAPVLRELAGNGGSFYGERAARPPARQAA